MIKLDYLIAGTGRSGTVYMARLLTSLGINCGHEAIFNHEGLSNAIKIILEKKPLVTSHCSRHDILNKEQPINKWLDDSKIRAESSYLAVPYLESALFKKTKIIHSVRHPLKVISSHIKDIDFFNFENEKFKVWINFILKFLPEIKDIDNNIERACYYYINWNKMIEKHAHFRHKVEDECSDELLNFLNVERTENIFTNTKINSWNKREEDLSIDQIPNGSIKKELIELARKYEYKLDIIRYV